MKAARVNLDYEGELDEAISGWNLPSLKGKMQDTVYKNCDIEFLRAMVSFEGKRLLKDLSTNELVLIDQCYRICEELGCFDKCL
jgi:hypothetical protein